MALVSYSSNKPVLALIHVVSGAVNNVSNKVSSQHSILSIGSPNPLSAPRTAHTAESVPPPATLYNYLEEPSQRRRQNSRNSTSSSH